MSDQIPVNYLNSVFVLASRQSSHGRRTRDRSSQQRYREMCCESIGELLDTMIREIPGLEREDFVWADALPQLSDPTQCSRQEYLKKVQSIIDDFAERLYYVNQAVARVKQAA